LKEDKVKQKNKVIETIKKKWLIDGTLTCLLVFIIIGTFIVINFSVQKLKLTPLDFTQEKLFTLTEESKEKVKDIDKEVNIYFIGYVEDSLEIDLTKQYNKVNEKINVEAVDITKRPDLANKYGIESGTKGIIVESEDKSKVLTEGDLYTYDMTTFETINVAEEKLTSSIISVVSDKIPAVYFLEGYSEFSLNQNMGYLGIFLQNEVTQINTLDILANRKSSR